jgi:menaquinol-cytochrome c reductase iron-sulfur subunit
MSSDESPPPTPPDAPEQPERREFLTKAAAVAIGSVVTLVPVGAGLVTALDPLRRRAGGGGFVHVTSLSALPNDGKPRRFQIVADRVDAWNKYSQVPVGAVYLRRVAEARVEALNVTCPHAGCPVEFKEDGPSFLCPCHVSRFHLDGTLADANSPSPRGLDSLEVEIRNETEVWVAFQNFEAGKATKVPIA